MTISSKKSFFNKRIEPRFPYSGFVFFIYKKSLNEARLENWSRSGLCMKTKRYFRQGEMITLSLPPSKYRDHKRQARIVWKNAESCGVQFCD
ncbi:MAG: PilZ domain-containing protein [Desulfobacterales bacterium]|nr:MAG: PilZ domain-containing protein [Desulfobacterales bacterium]